MYFHSMKKILALLFCFSVLIFGFAGCSKKSAQTEFAYEEAVSAYTDSAPLSINSSARLSKLAAPMAMNDVVYASGSAESAGFSKSELAATGSDSSGSAEEFERKLIKNGNISLEVTDLLKAQTAVENWVKQFGGYISNSNNGEKNSNYTVRIPAAKFDEAMDAAGTLGTVKNKNISTDDVSDQFYDLQTRLETKKVLRKKLNGYLSQATSMQDILKVESQLNSVQSEIESMEGRLKRLSSQIDFSTISIYVSLPYNATQGGGFALPDFGDGFRHFVSNIISYFGGFISVFFYIFICGIPLIALIAFLFWLLFGKVGLLIKLYNKLKK